MANSLLITNATILTFDEPCRVLTGHAVYIKDGVISKITASVDLPKADKKIDASGKILLPGFINSHTHCYSTFARGLTKTTPATSFTTVLKNIWWRLDKALTIEDGYYSALIVLLESIRHGTTTLIDHHAGPSAIRGSLNNIARAFRETGLRGCLCYEVSDRDGARATEEGLQENGEFISACKKDNNPQLQALFGLHASFTLSDLTLQSAARLGHDLGVGFHIHVAESAADQEYTLAQYGRRVVERLHDHAILGPSTIAAHCVHVNEKERALLAQTNTAVAHNPQSNMNNAVGIADIVAMNQKGVRVGLGTDAMTTCMLEEMRAALWCQHLLHGNPSIGFSEAAATLLVNNKKIAQSIFGQDLGVIKEGAPADIILMDYDPATPLHDENWLGHMVFGLSQAPIDTTIVAGQSLMENKKLLLDLDEKEIHQQARKHAEALWRRM